MTIKPPCSFCSRFMWVIISFSKLFFSFCKVKIKYRFLDHILSKGSVCNTKNSAFRFLNKSSYTVHIIAAVFLFSIYRLRLQTIFRHGDIRNQRQLPLEEHITYVNSCWLRWATTARGSLWSQLPEPDFVHSVLLWPVIPFSLSFVYFETIF